MTDPADALPPPPAPPQDEEQEEDAVRVAPAVPCVETAGSTAERLPGVVTADERTELLKAAEAALVFLRCVDWNDVTAENNAYDVEQALQDAIEKVEGAAAPALELPPHPQEETHEDEKEKD